ncbi:hypothetical protein NEUTE1DRAFT_124709 [Neurospora tetrasperma FGSC 2508]|uniref:Uncharacterized protein n=1 Tax=Neurospora tetrasperma (strain FGSC 2508 / ATCC MYA-4615 / P0657) TaxID=510951 RepID=F8MXJ5_NEUT8|nr:uncharacterized protein NEUTE1DRAFT_124709 [Neurospora tetrasperma FGSC 2508]EGO54466.1 hypothetical protein NEUTE1DRAFT_124709 [Neurospora tetrasperma FGSC 2508]
MYPSNNAIYISRIAQRALCRPSEEQIEPTQTVRQSSSDLDAEPSPWSCLGTHYPSKVQTTKDRSEVAREAAASIDKRLPGLFRLFSHGKERLPREARAANESIAPIPMIVQEEWAKMWADMHKQALVVSAIFEKQNEELRKIGRAYKDEVREVGEEIDISLVFARKEVFQEGMRLFASVTGLKRRERRLGTSVNGSMDGSMYVDFAMLLPQYNLPVETKSIETTQTDASYSKEVEHHQPMPAPTWALPLCGPLFNKFSPKNGTQNTTSHNNLKSTSTLCAPCVPEKDDFIIIDPPTTEDAPEADSLHAKEPLCDFEIQNEPGRRKFVMYLTEDIDEAINAEGMMLIASLLGTLRNGVVGDAPINYSTRRSANLIKIRAARWADEVGKEADKLLKKEAVKVARIRRKAQENKEVNGEEADSNDVK